MAVKTCRRCGMIFQHITGPEICYNCKKKDEEDYRRVKEYLYEYPGATMAQVCEAVDVTIKQIKNYLRQGRLTVSKDSPIGLDCERCGARIETGRYCDHCRNEMQNQFSSVAKGMQKPEQPMQLGQKDKDRMRYLDIDKLKR